MDRSRQIAMTAWTVVAAVAIIAGLIVDVPQAIVAVTQQLPQRLKDTAGVELTADAWWSIGVGTVAILVIATIWIPWRDLLTPGTERERRCRKQLLKICEQYIHESNRILNQVNYPLLKIWEEGCERQFRFIGATKAADMFAAMKLSQTPSDNYTNSIFGRVQFLAHIREFPEDFMPEQQLNVASDAVTSSSA